MEGFIGNDALVVLAILAIALQIIYLVESKHDVVIDIAYLENCQ
jgi:hypothetical protein